MRRLPPLRPIVLATAVWLTGPAAGQPTDPADRLPSLLASLDAEGFVERELAAREIENSPSITLDDIEAALHDPDLSPEQRRRLVVASRRRFFAEPRAAMGIMLGEMVSVGLRITGTTPGFDSANKLQANDIIAEIGGLPIRQPEDLQIAIISRSPGEEVPVVVVRGDQTVRVELELGAWAALGQQIAPRYEVLELAWAYRFGPALAADATQVVPSRRTRGELAPNRRGPDRRSELVIGGEPRDDAGQAAGLRLDRPLSAAERANPISYAERVALKLAEIEADIQLTEARLERARLRLEAVRDGDDRRRRDEAQQLVLQHERTLAAQRADAARLRAELTRVRDP